MSTLTKRVITAAVLLAIVGLALFGPWRTIAPWLFGAFLIVGLWEWSGFFVPPSVFARIAFGLFGIVAGLLALQFAAVLPLRIVLSAALSWWLLVAAWLFLSQRRISNPLTAAAGVLCLVPAWLALLTILQAGQGALLFSWLVLIVAAADIGAYFTGRSLGRRKLAPQISPGKTVEGLLGGLLFAGAAGAAGAIGFGQSPFAWGLLAPGVALISVTGDLTVSAFKRHAGLKDSGWILPGHGGVMDRLDSLVAAAPVFTLVLLQTEMLPG